MLTECPSNDSEGCHQRATHFKSIYFRSIDVFSKARQDVGWAKGKIEADQGTSVLALQEIILRQQDKKITMSTSESQTPREFALRVVKRLREAGYEALWAGGCVRDQLLGLQPKDYDIATSATPDQVRHVFGRRKTLAIGAAFGVITVMGSRGAGQIEVATFRQDAEYSDGRHPDTVTFSSAEEDAKRRDFTINGLFCDPLNNRVIDYVGGEHDLHAGCVRAIGDPKKRFHEDKLRLLRAVRFAATFNFHLDPETFDGIRENAGQIVVVSSERIAAEMRKILHLPSRRRGCELLLQTTLLSYILPEADPASGEKQQASTIWNRALNILESLSQPCFPVTLTVLLRELPNAQNSTTDALDQIARRWKLSNEEIRKTSWFLSHEPTLRRASEVPWPQLQRVLIHPDSEQLVTLSETIEQELTGDKKQTNYCRTKLSLPPEILNPPPFITGDDLIDQGIPPGKTYQTILEKVRDAQLNQEIAAKDEALELARSVWESQRDR